MTTYHTEQAVNNHILRGACGTTVRLYTYLRNAQTLAEAHGRSWIAPRAKTIAEDIGRHVRSVRRAMADLTQRGALIVQHRFHTRPDGLVRQISNRLRLVTTVIAALDIRERIKKRALQLFMYRSDKPVTPSTEHIHNPQGDLWKNRPVYRQLMQDGIKKRQ